MLDFDLTELYGVPTGRLNEQATRNKARFPEDFVFRLSAEEFKILKSQIAISSWGGRRVPPRAFTEQGVAMLSSVLRSKRAAEVNVPIMRTYVLMRKAIASNEELARRVERIDRKVALLQHQYDAFINPAVAKKKHPIGFQIDRTDEEDD